MPDAPPVMTTTLPLRDIDYSTIERVSVVLTKQASSPVNETLGGQGAVAPLFLWANIVTACQYS
jgi:hypothetical protein